MAIGFLRNFAQDRFPSPKVGQPVPAEFKPAPWYVGWLQRKTSPPPNAGWSKGPTYRYEQIGQWRFDAGHGLWRTQAGAWRSSTPQSNIGRVFARAYRNRPQHWAYPVNDVPKRRYTPPPIHGKQDTNYAFAPYGTSKFPFLHVYLTAYTPSVLKMEPYYNILKYAITPKRMGTFGVVPLQAQGTVQKAWPWQQTPHGFPVRGSWPMGVSG